MFQTILYKATFITTSGRYFPCDPPHSAVAGVVAANQYFLCCSCTSKKKRTKHPPLTLIIPRQPAGRKLRATRSYACSYDASPAGPRRLLNLVLIQKEDGLIHWLAYALRYLYISFV